MIALLQLRIVVEQPSFSCSQQSHADLATQTTHEGEKFFDLCGRISTASGTDPKDEMENMVG
jgi:hypothetical protein